MCNKVDAIIYLYEVIVMGKKEIITDPDGTRWLKEEMIYVEDNTPTHPMSFRGKILSDDDGNIILEEGEVKIPDGTPLTTWRRIRSKSEVNTERPKRIVSPQIRYNLEKQEHLGIINQTGRLLLEIERRRGGRKPKAPIWWIYDRSDELKNTKKYTRYGIALKLTEEAKKIWGMGEDVEITVEDVKKARQAMSSTY